MFLLVRIVGGLPQKVGMELSITFAAAGAWRVHDSLQYISRSSLVYTNFRKLSVNHRLLNWPDFHCVVLVLWILTVMGCLLETWRSRFVLNSVKVCLLITAASTSACMLFSLWMDLNVCLHARTSSLMGSNLIHQFYRTFCKLLGNGHFLQPCTSGT